MRESPYVKVAKTLIGEGIKPLIYDPAIQTERLIGSNKEMVQKALGHLQRVLVPSLDALASADLILINHAIVDASLVGKWTQRGIYVMDLVGIKDVDRNTENYEGIYW